MAKRKTARQLSQTVGIGVDALVALRGPRMFGAQFDNSTGAQELLARGLIRRPKDNQGPAPLTPEGWSLLQRLSEIARAD
jgi:hypothetical protein